MIIIRLVYGNLKYYCWVGLGWVGLGWVGLGWVGLGWVGLGNCKKHTIKVELLQSSHNNCIHYPWVPPMAINSYPLSED